MVAVTRKKIIVTLIVILCWVFFCPRTSMVRASVTAGFGAPRPWTAGKNGSGQIPPVPRPGFDLYNFQVMDDPASALSLCCFVAK